MLGLIQNILLIPIFKKYLPSPGRGYHRNVSLEIGKVDQHPHNALQGRERDLHTAEEHTPQTPIHLRKVIGTIEMSLVSLAATSISASHIYECLPCSPDAPILGCHSEGSRILVGRSHHTGSLLHSAVPAGTSSACLSFSGASGGSHSGTFSSSLRSLRSFPQTWHLLQRSPEPRPAVAA